MEMSKPSRAKNDGFWQGGATGETYNLLSATAMPEDVLKTPKTPKVGYIDDAGLVVWVSIAWMKGKLVVDVANDHFSLLSV